MITKADQKHTLASFLPLVRVCTPLFLLLLLRLLPLGFSQNPDSALNVTDLDDGMSYALGFNDAGFVGGIVLTLLLTCLMMFPIVMMGRKRNWGYFPEIVTVFLGLVAGVAIGWLNYWVLLVVCLIVALLFSGKIKDWASGGA